MCKSKLRFILPILLALAVIGGSLLFPHPARAVGPYYWVNGSGNTNDATNHWSTSSGGAGNVANVPTSTDNVIFDNLSDTAGAFTVTVNAAFVCANMDFSLVDQTVTFAGSSTLGIYGSLTKKSGMLWTYSGALTFRATSGGKTITSSSVGYSGMTFDGAGGSWQLQDDLTVTNTINLTNGTLDTNGKTVTSDLFSVSAGTSTLTMGASTWNVLTASGSAWGAGSLGTLNAGTSTINTNGGTFAGGSKTYYNLNYVSTAAGTITGSNTFNNLTITGNNVANAQTTLAGNQVVNGTFTATGYSQSRRMNLFSDTLHTARTLTVATMGTNSNVLFRDITAAGAANWNLSAQTGIGNASGNTGITFPTGMNVYATQIPGNVNWTNTLNWANTSNGTPGSATRVPLPQDMAIFDSHSMGVPGIIVTFDIANLPGIDSTLVTNNPQFNGTTDYFYNSMKLGSCIWNVTNDTYLLGNTAQTLQGDFSSGSGNLRIDVQGGSIDQSGDLTAGGIVYLTSGVWVTEGYDVTAKFFDSVTTTYNRALWMGNADSTLSSTFTLNGTTATTKWNVAATNLNIDQIQSTIILTNSTANGQTFAGGGMTYYNLVIAGSGAYTVTFTGTNTFNDFWILRSNAVYPDVLTATSAAAKTITGNVQQTIQHLYSPLYGTTVTSIGTTDWAKASGLVALDYLAFTGGANTSVASGGATPFLAGSHSTGSPQTGWSFTDATAPTISALPATLTTRTTAVLNGSVDSLGSYTTEGVYISFQYDLTGAYTAPTTTSETLYTSTGTKSAGITGLTFDTTYHFRIVARYNGASYLYGNDTTFLTLGAPTVNTQNATNYDNNAGTATLNGVVLDFGDYHTLSAYFQYTPSASYPAWDFETTSIVITDSATDWTFPKNIAGLVTGTTYKFRAVALYNATAHAYGSVLQFTSGTIAAPPFTPPAGVREGKAPAFSLNTSGSFINTTGPNGTFSTTINPLFPGAQIWIDVANASQTPSQLPLMIMSGFLILVSSLGLTWLSHRFQGTPSHFLKVGWIFILMCICVGVGLYDSWMAFIFIILGSGLALMSQQKGVY